MSPNVRMIPAALVLAALVGCGGAGGDAPTAPAPRPTLILDFGAIEVIEDCDGIEGDGDFDFQVAVNMGFRTDEFYRELLNLGPGGKSRVLGRRSYELPPVIASSVRVTFVASELDRSIVGQEYNDDRLSKVWADFSHEYRDGEWSGLGPRSITLGSSGCLVKLSWTAEEP